MELCNGNSKVVIPLRATRRYLWETLLETCKQKGPPYWIRVEGTYIPLDSEESLRVGCQVCAAYHDWVAYNAPLDDGFLEDMQAREAQIEWELST